MAVEIIKDWPPNYAAIVAAFPAVASMQPIFAWGGVILNPHGIAVDAHLERHEGLHFRQQEAIGGPEAWWEAYLEDFGFRREQELAAYRVQLASFGAVCRDREKRHRYALALATHLTGGMYGDVGIDRAEALRRIRA